jgi:hypothetical protein
VPGWVFDRNLGLRPILGLPGAAILGPPAETGIEITAAAVSPGQDYMLVLAGPERRPLLLRGMAASALEGAAPGADEVALSAAGSAVMLYAREAARIQVLAGLPETSRVLWEEDSPGALSAVAVSDDGSAVLAAMLDGEQSWVYLLTPEAGPRYLMSVAGPVSLTFLVNTGDAVLASGLRSEVFMIRDAKGAAEIVPLADERHGVSRPVAVAASADNRRVLIANAEPGGVVSLDLGSRAAVLVPCLCTPTLLERVSGSVFRLNGPSAPPLWLFEDRGQEPRIVFVPAEEAAAPEDMGGGR